MMHAKFPPYTVGVPVGAEEAAEYYRKISDIGVSVPAGTTHIRGAGTPRHPGAGTPTHDPVTKPAHYQRGGIETIDYIRATLGNEGFAAYCLGNVLKYVSRFREKDGVQDLKKAQVYLEWAIGAQEPKT